MSAQVRHDPLDRQIAVGKKKAEGKFSRADRNKVALDLADEDDLGDKSEFLDAKTSKKILKQAQEQREEMVALEKKNAQKSGAGAGGAGGKRGGGLGAHLLRPQDSDDDEEPTSSRRLGGGGSDAEDDEEYDDDVEVGSDGYVDIADMEGVDAADAAAMAAFFPSGATGGGGGAAERRTINDLIMDKIREKEEWAAQQQEQQQGGGAQTPAGGGGGGGGGLPAKVVAVYTEIGKMLKHYNSGKLPKAFKIIPSLTNWEEVLWLTGPDEWSPQGVLAATRVFASNLNERMAQRFYNLILLGRIQADIDKWGRLNYHLYAALRKAVYKPAAFYKGILLPLASGSGGPCSLKEATVIASVLAKVSVPANHSAAVLLKLTELPYSGPTSLFIRVLLNKKYALPHRVVDALVDHFLGFAKEGRASGGGGGGGDAAAAATTTLPVLWHQSLLVFAQRYKRDVTRPQREAFKGLFKAQFHHQITPEVRRELFSGPARGEEEQGLEGFALRGGMED